MNGTIAAARLPIFGLALAILLPGAASAQSAPSAFTSGLRYDAARRLIGAISPDPDGAGPLRYMAVRNTYDGDGRLTMVEKGELANWQSEAVAPSAWSDFTVFNRVETVYEASGRKALERTWGRDPATGLWQPISVTQYSYNAVGRADCTATRMNPAAFDNLPDACSPSDQGSYGADRITRSLYDGAGQVLKVQKAVGTGLQEDYATYTYTPNGKQSSVVDADGNASGYSYDGFDRLIQWNFPDSVTKGAISSTDYEAYTYDANGNRLTWRKRDGNVIAFAFDALNRVATKTEPGAVIYYGYNLQGLQTYARYGSANGPGVTQSYDGFGKLASSSNNLSGSALTLDYQWDANGNRTRVTYPDGGYFMFDYDGLDRQTATRENGGAVVATILYDNQGQRSNDSRGAVASAYGYDGAARVIALSDDLAGTGDDAATTFAYNPANQIVSRTRSNPSYAFPGYVNVNRDYAVNGLNQYASAGPASFSYDANGNLISDGTNTYGYDVENRLISRSGVLTLSYDPNGRLWQTSGGTSGTTRYLYDGDELVAEYDGSGNLLRRYLHGAGDDDPILWYEGAGFGDRRSLQTDQQGSIVSIADAGGNKLAINSFDEYGIPAAGNLGRFQFTGQAWIPDLGMYYYKARIYSPTLGRFMQTDPIGYNDEMNLYAYAGNDPVNKDDPTGLYERDVHYALTGLLARAAGLSIRNAQAIAHADQGVDDNPATSPMGPLPFGQSVRVRRDYHFTTKARRDQLYSTYSKSRSASDLGVYLHAQQDSYSHAGYGPRIGHISHWEEPDKTYNDVAKAGAMARDTYDVLLRSRSVLGASGRPIPWDQLEPYVTRFNMADNPAAKLDALLSFRNFLDRR